MAPIVPRFSSFDGGFLQCTNSGKIYVQLTLSTLKRVRVGFSVFILSLPPGTRSTSRLGKDDGSGLLARLTLLQDHLVCDTVQVALALRGQFAATLGQLLDQADRLQGLQRLAGDSGGRLAVVGRVHSVAPAASVDACD